MKSNPRLSYAISVVLSAQATAYADVPSTTASSDAIAEIVVTAQRREENIQNVPITITALTAETIKQLNVTTFDDFVKYVPNVTAASLGPGQSNIYMRGLSTGGGNAGVQGGGQAGRDPQRAGRRRRDFPGISQGPRVSRWKESKW